MLRTVCFLFFTLFMIFPFLQSCATRTSNESHSHAHHHHDHKHKDHSHAHETKNRPVKRLKTQTYLPSVESHNSHLIMGNHEIILVNSQYNPAEAQKLVELVAESNLNPTAIFLTSANPLNYLSVRSLLNAYPRMVVVARPTVARRVARESRTELQKAQKSFGLSAPLRATTPKPFSQDKILIESHAVRLLDFESKNQNQATLLYIPSSETLVDGDLITNRVHPNLSSYKNQIRDRSDFLESLLKKYEIDRVLPSQGKPGSKRILRDNIRYLRDFQQFLDESETPEQVIRRMKELYPDYQSPEVLESNARAFFTGKK